MHLANTCSYGAYTLGRHGTPQHAGTSYHWVDTVHLNMQAPQQNMADAVLDLNLLGVFQIFLSAVRLLRLSDIIFVIGPRYSDIRAF